MLIRGLRNGETVSRVCWIRETDASVVSCKLVSVIPGGLRR